MNYQKDGHYKHEHKTIDKNKAPHANCVLRLSTGAGDGNRTRVFSLGSWHSTIELHLHMKFFKLLLLYHNHFKKAILFYKFFIKYGWKIISTLLYYIFHKKISFFQITITFPSQIKTILKLLLKILFHNFSFISSFFRPVCYNRAVFPFLSL